MYDWLALTAENRKALLKDPNELPNISNGTLIQETWNSDHKRGEETVDYLYKTVSETTSAVAGIHLPAEAGFTYTPKPIPDTRLGR